MSIYLYHMTHVGNLESILKEGRMYCDALAPRYNPRSIAYTNLKMKRAARSVPISPGGSVADYVPFYFAPRSPMLYAIHTGHVRSGLSQAEVVYLVTSVEVIALAGKRFVFTDRHPLSNFPRFSNDLSRITQFIDWNVMRSDYWHDCPQYPDRKSRRQAEFLVYREVEWGLIEQIGVYDTSYLKKVLQILQGAAHQPPVSVRREWYY